MRTLSKDEAKRKTQEAIKIRVDSYAEMIEQFDLQIMESISVGRYFTVLERDNLPTEVFDYYFAAGYKIEINQEFAYVIISWG